MSMLLNIKFPKFYYILELNTQLWEENMMLNYKLYTKPLKDNSNKKLFLLFFMKEDLVLLFKLLKKWIFLTYLTPYSEKEITS
jgi:hypothetical protein